jgi:predicted nuclease of predicted toxin-antitoxin system
MQFKLDENFGTRTQHLFREAGHEIQTVRGQGLEGSSDRELYQVCCSEGRCLVTLDLDFANVTLFPPEETDGVVVIRVHENPSLGLLEQLVRQFLRGLSGHSVEKRLWIVEPGRIRIYQPETEE